MMEKPALRWVATFSLLAACGVASADRPEPNAFLNHRAVTVGQLVHEVQIDQEVADRYERHFGKTKDELIVYFGQLHLAKLNAEGTYMTYLVDDRGVIKAKPERMKAGTLVFADAKGNPVLKASCGNALVSGSNLLATAVSPLVGVAVPALHEITATNYDPPDFPTTAIAEIPPVPLALQPIIPDQVVTGNRNQSFAVPAVLAALSGAGALLIGGGHGSSPVPEPASIIVIVGAVAAFKLRRKSK
jgi:hypothetical protein